MLVFWIALAVLVVLSVAGFAFAFFRALHAWRTLKATGGRLGGQLDEIARATEEIETHLERATDGAERVAATNARLSRSRARLSVQLAALKEARATARRAVPFLGER